VFDSNEVEISVVNSHTYDATISNVSVENVIDVLRALIENKTVPPYASVVISPIYNSENDVRLIIKWKRKIGT
jgi:pyruvate-formate lyase-activating enzyme